MKPDLFSPLPTRKEAEQLPPGVRAAYCEARWSLAREFYLACGPTAAQMRRQAMRLRADANWLLAVADGLEPAERAMREEYGL